MLTATPPEATNEKAAFPSSFTTVQPGRKGKMNSATGVLLRVNIDLNTLDFRISWVLCSSTQTTLLQRSIKNISGQCNYLILILIPLYRKTFKNKNQCATNQFATKRVSLKIKIGLKQCYAVLQTSRHLNTTPFSFCNSKVAGEYNLKRQHDRPSNSSFR